MKKVYCDRCGADITAQEAYGLIWMDYRDYEITLDMFYDSPWPDRDYCESCMAEILDFIKIKPGCKAAPAVEEKKEEPVVAPEVPKVEDVEEKAEPKPKKVAKATGKKKPLDKGKIGALYKAGWSVAKITDEIGCHKSAVYNALAELRGKGEIA